MNLMKERESSLCVRGCVCMCLMEVMRVVVKMLSRKLDMHSLGLRGEVGWGLIHSRTAGSNGTRTQVSWFQNYLLLAFLFSQGKCKHLAL